MEGAILVTVIWRYLPFPGNIKELNFSEPINFYKKIIVTDAMAKISESVRPLQAFSAGSKQRKFCQEQTL